MLRVFEPPNPEASRLAALTTPDAATRIAADERKLAEIVWIRPGDWLQLFVLTALSDGEACPLRLEML